MAVYWPRVQLIGWGHLSQVFVGLALYDLLLELELSVQLPERLKGLAKIVYLQVLG